MTAISEFLENDILNQTLRGVAGFNPGGLSLVYLGLFVSPAGNDLEDNILTSEVATSAPAAAVINYTREAITFTDPLLGPGGVSDNSNAISVGAATSAAWGSVTHVAVMDSSVPGAGQVLYWGALTGSKFVDVDDTFTVAPGALSVTLT
jgi:hypothetical protein